MRQNDKQIDYLDEVIHAQPQRKREIEPSIRSERIDYNLIIDHVIDENRQLKKELSEQISHVRLELNEKLDDIASNLLDDFKRELRLDKQYLSVLLFIQSLDKYLDDNALDRGFVDKVRQDIRRVLTIYGYSIVDYDEMADDLSKYYDIIFVDNGIISDYELVSRAIVDKDDNTIIKGKVYIEQKD